MRISLSYSDKAGDKLMHSHDYHQLIYVTEGQIELTVGNESYTVKKGSLAIISRYEQHRVTVQQTPYRRYALRIDADLPAERDSYLLYSVLINRPDGFCRVIQANEEIDGVFGELKREQDELPFNEKMCELLLQKLLILVYRVSPELFGGNDSSTSEIVRKIQTRFETQYYEPFSLEQLSREYHLSVYYLSHAFKRITGFSVMEFLKTRRLTAAKKYLKYTDTDIGVIAEKCGFSDCSNFSRTFKTETGYSPTLYRKQFTKNEK